MLSDEYYIIHLTLHGWVEGTEKSSKWSVTRPIPDDTVLTLTFHEIVSGILNQPEHKVDVKYLIDQSSDILKILFATFGKLPSRFESWVNSMDW